MGDIKTLLTEIEKARPGYLKAQRYSDGEVAEVWSNDRLAHYFAKHASKFQVNIARRPIDAVLDRLEIMEVSAADDTTMTDLLNSVWDANQLDLEVPDALDKAETFGDAYLVVWPRVDDPNMVDVFVNDPLGMRVIYDPENPRRKDFAGRTWIDGSGFRRVTIWRAGPSVERWISKQEAQVGDTFDDDQFTQLVDKETGEPDQENLNMGLDVPVFHLRNGRPYGKPTHKSAYGTQNMLTKEIATMMDATDGYGLPFRYALTKSGTAGTLASVNPWDDEDDQDTEDTVSPSAPKGPRAEPGLIAKLTDTDAVGQLEPAQVNNFLDPISMTLRLSSVVTNTPLGYFDPSAAAASGESKKEHDKPAAKKAERHQLSYDATLRDTLEYALALLGQNDVKVMITWAPVQSVDESEETDLAAKRKTLGVPFKKFMTQLGYPDEEVQKWIDDATPDDEVLLGRVQLLAAIGQAAKDLGTASTLGVVDPALVQELIRRTISPDAVPATGSEGGP